MFPKPRGPLILIRGGIKDTTALASPQRRRLQQPLRDGGSYPKAVKAPVVGKGTSIPKAG